MPQLQINQGPQDALLYDNSKSYFTNVGYVRTSNFQMELRDVDSQNAAALGSTVQFVIPKAADLLGPCDLICQMDAPTNSGVAKTYSAWVDALGHAMIEKITFSVGSHDVETLSGEQLHIINELMKGNDARLGEKQILKTGRPAVTLKGTPGATAVTTEVDTKSNRLIMEGQTAYSGQKLIIPLGLFFTKHPSQYFPLAAIAGCNDVRIAIKFRPLNELVQVGCTDFAIAKDVKHITKATAGTATMTNAIPKFGAGNGIVPASVKLRCHYVHVTGPEATTLMNKEHVRLLKLWQQNNKIFTLKTSSTGESNKIPIDLSFLHPVQELVIVIRKTSEMGAETEGKVAPSAQDQKAATKSYFAFQGSGKDPNVDRFANRVPLDSPATGVTGHGASDAPLGAGSTVELKTLKLTLNGQERHPGLQNSALDRDYLMERLMPMLHSNTSNDFLSLPSGQGSSSAFTQLAEQLDRKEIYVYPFSIAPENQNPSGAVNFSKVSHAKLEIEVEAKTSLGETAEEVAVDIWGVHYNWLQIKDGRALTSFA